MPLHEPVPARTVRVKIVADSEIAALPDWKNSISAMFDSISRCMRPWAHVGFAIDTFVTWDCAKAPSYDSLLPGDCLIREVPKGESDIVVYFDKWGYSPTFSEAMPLYEQGYAYIRLPMQSDGETIDRRARNTVIHWLGHLFGAVHCYYDSSRVTLMNPFVHEGIIVEGDTGREAVFHRGNGMIMSVLSRRPFEESGWDSTLWPPIRAVYGKIRDHYNRWRIDTSGELVDYSSDAFHESNPLLYLSSWASLCGLPAVSLSYLDSVAAVYRAIKITCIREGIVGKTRLCRVCGYDAVDVTNWLDLKLFNLKIRRAMVYLRAGELAKADSCQTEAIDRIPSALMSIRGKYEAGYRFYRSRCVRRAGNAPVFPALR
jgi:hypothetical protein